MKPYRISPERLTLRFVLLGLGALAVACIEGMLLRTQLINVPLLTDEHWYAILTAHPLVGIYGWAYLSVMGAFLYLVPKLLNKPLFSPRLATVTLWTIVGGLALAWSSGFFLHFAALYTVYWPLPVVRFAPATVTMFAVGLALVEIGVLLFVVNIGGTVLRRPKEERAAHARPTGALLLSAFGIDVAVVAIANRLARRRAKAAEAADGGVAVSVQKAQLPVFVVSVMRGSIDAVINAVVLAGAGILMLVFVLPALVAGITMDPLLVDPLVYKNVFWYGLDMVADGDVLIWVAGSLYLLAPLLVGNKLFGENIVRWVILADLIISMGVWSHHLMSDLPQPLFMRLVSGQFITWGEFMTMGLSFFAALMTVYLARPVKMTMPLKFMLGGIFGFMIGGFSGLLQANSGLNVIMHNTQWVPGFHVHEMILVGLGNVIFAVVYTLLPMLTGTGLKSARLSNAHFWLWTIGGLGMAWSMGLSWSVGMLRRTLYPGTDMYVPYQASAMLFGIVLMAGLAAFVANLLKTYGLKTLVGMFAPEPKAEPKA